MKSKYETEFNTRQYMIKEDFEIYYYKDHPSTKVESHSHRHYEFYFLLEGNVSLVINGIAYQLKERDIILIPPHVQHYAIIHDPKIPYRRFVFWVSEDCCNRLVERSKDYTYLFQQACIMNKFIFHNNMIAFNAIQVKVYRLIEEINGNSFGRKEQIKLCTYDLMLQLNRIVYQQMNEKNQVEEEHLYGNLMSYIDQHLDEELSLVQLAQTFYISKYYISHLFKKSMGLSIHQYIIKKRLGVCKELMLGEGNISTIYGRFGFKNYSSFYRAFKKEFGLSPKEYKQLHS